MAVLLEVLVNFIGRGHWGKTGLGVFFVVLQGFFVSFFLLGFFFVCFKIGVSINEDNLECESRYLRSDGTFVM